MNRHQIQYNSSVISYICMGNGPQLVICFHGYAEESGYFSFLEKQTPIFTFIAIDLPIHGQTNWKGTHDFTAGDLQIIVLKILSVHGWEHRKVTILGFSLGGRVGLSLFQLLPQQTARIVLLAPDGLKLNFWYWFATQTWLGNRVFSFTMKHPQWFFFLLKVFHRIGLVNASIIKFVSFYISDPEARSILYKRWMVLRKIKPNLEKIKSLVKNNNVPVRLLYGKHDRIILPARGKKFMNGIEAYATITVIDSGHQVLHERHAREIIEALLH